MTTLYIAYSTQHSNIHCMIEIGLLINLSINLINRLSAYVKMLKKKTNFITVITEKLFLTYIVEGVLSIFLHWKGRLKQFAYLNNNDNKIAFPSYLYWTHD